MRGMASVQAMDKTGMSTFFQRANLVAKLVLLPSNNPFLRKTVADVSVTQSPLPIRNVPVPLFDVCVD